MVGKKTIQIDGGMGRVLCAEPAIRKLAEAGNEVSVITSWPDVLKYHPNIKFIWNLDTPNLWENVISGTDFITPEPYNDHYYYNKEHHMVQSFDWLINKDNSADLVKPKIYLSDEEISNAKKQLTEMIGHHGSAAFTIVIQPFGSTATMENINQSLHMPRENRSLTSDDFREARRALKPETADNTNRSLSIDTVIQILDQLDKDFLIINFSHLEIKHPKIYNFNGDLRMWFAIISLADYFIGVDSIGQHIAASSDLPGHVFFGGTAVENLAYPDLHTVMQRDGFPKAYIPYRQNVSHALNDKAMSFDQKDIAEMCEKINKKFFG